jgi:hypothetical protein
MPKYIIGSGHAVTETGRVVIPSPLKLFVVDKPAMRQHEGINLFTREPMIYKVKAASKVIKVRPPKALKDAI